MKKIVLLVVACNFALITVAFAHSSITTTPQNNEIVQQSLKIISLNFAKKTKVLKFKVTNSSNETMPNGGELRKGFIKKFEATVQDLKPDAYTVNWSAVGLDGHPVKNKFNFTIK